MSENIIIQEGGVGKQLAVDKLRTDQVGGGSCLWVPEDEVQLGTKSVSKNGTYVARNDGYYGYSQFSVSGVGTATGRDPVTGQEKMVTVDPETGDLVETVLPVEIRVTAPPTKTEYQSGETINISGMVVKAYGANGDEMQVVPIGEITINPTVAPPASENIIVSYDASKLEGIYAINPLIFTKSFIMRDNSNKEAGNIRVTASSGYFLTVSIGYYWVSDQSGYITQIGENDYQHTTFEDARSVVMDEQEVNIATEPYTSMRIHVDDPTYPSINTGNNLFRDMYRLLYMGYGTMENAEITVSWHRPGDGKVLETTFGINVG